MHEDAILSLLRSQRGAPPEARVALFNVVQAELGALVADLNPDPACAPRLIEAERITANDYNPNKVAAVEMDLLETSMRANGITMAVVVTPKGEAVEDGAEVVDGFHRRSVATVRLGRRYLPCAVIAGGRAERIAATVRHNRARGKHEVALMAGLVKEMLRLEWDDERIAGALGMSVEELLRLRQMVGAARLLAGEEYSKSWGNIGSS